MEMTGDAAGEAAEALDPGSAPAAPRRRPLRRLLLVAAALLVLLALLAALAPWILESLGPGVARRWFAERHRGRLEIGALDLSWTGRQRVEGLRLFDPQGGEVARASLDLPPLLDLVRGGGRRIGEVRAEVSADLVADDAGVSNLDRALEETEEARERRERREGEEAEGGLDLGDLDLGLYLEAPRISWSDATTRAAGEPFVVEALRVEARIAPGAPIEATASGSLGGAKVGGATGGALRLEARLEDRPPATPRGKLDLAIEGLATALVDDVARLDGLLLAALGPTIALTAEGEGTAEAGSIALDLRTERAKASFRGDIADGVLRGAPGSSLRWVQRVEPALIERLAGPALPPGARLALQPGDQVWAVSFASLSLPIARALEARKDGGDFLSGLLSGAEAELAARAAGLVLEDPARIPAPGRIALGELKLTAKLSPRDQAPDDAFLALEAQVQLDAGGPVQIQAYADVEDLRQVLAWKPERPLDLVRARFDVIGLSPQLAGAVSGFGERLAAQADGALDLSLRAEVGLAAAPGAKDARPAWARWAARARGTCDASASRSARGGGKAPGAGPGLESVQVHAALGGEKALLATAGAAFRGAPGSRLELAAELLSWPAEGEVPRGSARISGERLPIALLDDLADAHGRLRALLGEVAVEIEIDCAGDAQDLTARIAGSTGVPGSGPGILLDVGLAWDGERMRLAPPGADGAKESWVAVQRGTLVALAQGSLPGGLEMGNTYARATLRKLDLPLSGLIAAPASERSQALEELLDDLAADALVSIPEPDSREPALRWKEIEVASLACETALAPAGARSARLSAKLGGPGGGSLSAKVEGLRSSAGSETKVEVQADLPTATAGRWMGGGMGGGTDLSAKLGERLAVALSAVVSTDREPGLRADFELDLKAKAGATRASGKARIEGPLGGAELPAAQVDLDVKGLDLAAPLLSPGVAVPLREILGDGVKLALRNHPSGDFELKLEGARLALDASGRSADRTFVARGSQGLALELSPTPELVQQYVGASLPPGAALALEEGSAPLALELRDIELPLDAWIGEERATLASVVERAKAKASLRVPGLRYSQPPPSSSEGPQAAAVPVSLRDVKLEAELSPRQPLRARLSGSVEPEGALDLDLVALDPAGFLSEGERRAAAAVDVKGRAAGLPTALVDALARQEGLLVDVLGAQLDVSIEGKLPSGPGEGVTAALKSPKASVDVAARLEGTTLRADGEQGIQATLPLSPLFSERIVGSLVPMLVELSKPEGAPPVGLRATVFALPLDGDLSRLDGSVRLDLNEVAYQVLPSLRELLAASGKSGSGTKLTTIEPLQIDIVKGVCRYERLPIQVQGTEVVFKGSYDLAQRRFELSTRVPLKLLGSSVERKLEEVRDLLDPDLAVPIELTGTWDKPRVRVGKDFLKDVVEQAAKGALLKGLDRLLEKEKKKKGGG